MKVLSILAVVLFSINYRYLPVLGTKFTAAFQKICKEMLPTNSSEIETMASLVCGEKVTDPAHLKTLQKTGLIHIFVVSGGHLVVISELLMRLRWGWPLRFLFLSVFTLFTGFQVPCFRSLLQFSMSEFLIFSGHPLRSDQKVFLCGLFLLLISPDLCASLSLQLSWGAALALAVHQQLLRSQHFLLKVATSSLLVYLMMYPLLSVISGLNPLSIIWNITLGSILTVFLFPLCGLAAINTYALWILERLMPLFWSSLESAKHLTSAFPALSWNISSGWIWILGWHGVAHLYITFHRRKYST